MDTERSMSIMNRNKHIMQENLKKVFMRSVCALNFEAMNILDPADQNVAQAKMERELERQMDSALGISQAYNTASKSEISFNLSENNGETTERDIAQMQEREFMTMALNQEAQQHEMDANTRKIENKDSMWKPAPIMGKELKNPMIVSNSAPHSNED